jgi:hypothetical protein
VITVGMFQTVYLRFISPKGSLRTLQEADETSKSQYDRCGASGFMAISAMALSAAINGSIFAVPEACLVMTMALPLGSTLALPTAHAISAWPPWAASKVARQRGV